MIEKFRLKCLTEMSISFIINTLFLVIYLKNVLIYENPIKFCELTKDFHKFFRIKPLHEVLSNYTNEKIIHLTITEFYSIYQFSQENTSVEVSSLSY